MAKTGSIGFTQGTQDITNNRTYLEVRGYITTSGDSWRGDSRTGTISISQNGTTIYSGSFTHGAPKNSTTELFAVGLWVSHDSVGSSGTITASYNYDSGWCTGSGSTTLTSIPRQANITSAPDFTDEDNPTIAYSNPAGSAVSSLQACISLTGSTDNIAYRDISKTDSRYTFTLADAERDVLRNATLSGSNSRTVYFYVKTVIGSNTFHSAASRTFTVINNKPTFTATVKDVNPATLAITNDESVFIRYHSNAEVNVQATAYKQASITAIKTICGSQNLSTATGVINGVDSGNFVFSVTDNRGNTVTESKQETFIEYIKLSCDIAANPPDADGDLLFEVSGNYYNNSFGATDNALTVEYCYSENGGADTEWAVLSDVNYDGNKYSVTCPISGLNYLSSYVIKARATDLLSEVAAESKTLKTVPVFDWGEDGFNFNVPVKIQGADVMETIGEKQDPLGFTPVKQGYLGNAVTVGWSGSRLKAQVDSTDLGNFVFDGNVCEYGANSNGCYYKFPDGSLICKAAPYFADYACTASWGNIYEGPAMPLGNWAHAFIDTPAVNITWVGSRGGIMEGLLNGTNTYIGDTYMSRGTAATTSGYVHVIGIGRWK